MCQAKNPKIFISMELQDSVVSIHPYYRVKPENIEIFSRLADDLIETTRGEMGCIYYGFSFALDEVYCRQAYKNAETLLAHLDNVSDLSQRILQVSEIIRLEIHGPAEEIAKIREFEPIIKYTPKYFILKGGFRN